jgi:hypothetical protein
MTPVIDVVYDTLIDMAKRYNAATSTNGVWLVSPRVRSVLTQRDLRIRKLWPARRSLRRSVHRAYRRAGMMPPRYFRLRII